MISTTLDDPERLKRFEKVLYRGWRTKNSVIELWPKCWVCASNRKADYWGTKFATLLEQEDDLDVDSKVAINERLFVTTLLYDSDHCNGFLGNDMWDNLQALNNR